MTPATPRPSQIRASSPGPESTAPAASEIPDAGNVEEQPVGPMLSIEPVDANTVRATIGGADARAWRLVVAGTGDQAADRLEIVVETGDVAPAIAATEIRDGQVVGVMDLSGFGDPTAAAGGCHATLRVCIDSDAFRLPAGGDGRLTVTLTRMNDTGPLTIVGGTAGWPGEPFILGPWTETEAFPWDPAAAS